VHRIETNPANLSRPLSELFPQGALVAEMRGSGDTATLYPEEAHHVRRAVRKRAEEFAAGRSCARLLLREFGIASGPIGVGDERQPLWPDGLVGSITHTRGLCAAVLAPQAAMRSLGIDSEVKGGVKTELWRGICTPAETAWLGSLPQSEQAAAATLIFSAKEAFYKCQFPLTQERLGFHVVSVEIPAWGLGQGFFRIHPQQDLALHRYAAWPLQGQYLFHEQFITTAMALPVSTPCRRETP
jgi:enterobactin synthetase component D / holo-[acyl-carrier protein] synthase